MSNPNEPTNFSYDIYNGIDDELDAAYAANVSNGIVPAPEMTTSTILGAIPSPPEVQPLIGVDPTFQVIAERSYRSSSALFERIGIRTPDLSEFVAAGVDFKILGEAYESLDTLNLEPQLVVAPVLESAQWTHLFQVLQDDLNVNHNDRIKNGGLHITSELETYWHNLQSDRHNTRVNGSENWQIGVVPGTGWTDIREVDSNGTANDETIAQEIAQRLQILPTVNFHGIHPTIPVYLTLQAVHLQRNERPIDSVTWTWLEGTFGDANDLRAPSGHWDTELGRVWLSWNRVDRQVDTLGIRIPVWGNM